MSPCNVLGRYVSFPDLWPKPLKMKRLIIKTFANCMHKQRTTSSWSLSVMPSHPLCRTCFDHSSAVLEWLGNGDCYLMHKMQSGGWLYCMNACPIRLPLYQARLYYSHVACIDVQGKGASTLEIWAVLSQHHAFDTTIKLQACIPFVLHLSSCSKNLNRSTISPNRDSLSMPSL